MIGSQHGRFGSAAFLLGATAAMAACDRNARDERGDPVRPNIEAARPELKPADTAETRATRGARGGEPTGPTDIAARGQGGPSTGVRKAAAEFKTVEGVKLDGEAELIEVDGGVRISVTVEDAPPGKKGIHVHQRGDCSDIPKQSMGGHFAPHGEPHGLPGAAARHPGDLGNITIGKDGTGKLEIVAPNVNLQTSDPMTILGRAIVIHTGEDKGSQPTGGAGNPIACAEIRAD